MSEEVDVERLKSKYYGLKSAVLRKSRHVSGRLREKGFEGGAILVPGEDDDLISELNDIYSLSVERIRIKKELKKAGVGDM